MENYFLDGTKIEANANKYTFVWKKATSKFEEKNSGNPDAYSPVTFREKQEKQKGK